LTEDVGTRYGWRRRCFVANKTKKEVRCEVDKATHKALKTEAQREGSSIAVVARRAILAYFAKKDGE